MKYRIKEKIFEDVDSVFTPQYRIENSVIVDKDGQPKWEDFTHWIGSALLPHTVESYDEAIVIINRDKQQNSEVIHTVIHEL